MGLMLLALVFGLCACGKAKHPAPQSTELRPSPEQAAAARAVAERVSAVLGPSFDGGDALFDLAPNFGEALSQQCEAGPCQRVELLPLYPAGRGLVAKPRLHRTGDSHTDFPQVFLRRRVEQWQLLDDLPHEIEAAPRQFSVEAKVRLQPQESIANVDATIEILAADQPYLLFDFFDADSTTVLGLTVEAAQRPLRYSRHGSLLIVELPKETRTAHLRFRYQAALPSDNRDDNEFVLYENWLPYLGGRASFRIELDLPKGFALGTPSQLLPQVAPGRDLHLLEAEALDRYPIVGSLRPYSTLDFAYQGVEFEIWLRPDHHERLRAVATAVRAAMDSFEFLGAFPATRYRVLEASYAEGHGALGLQQLMVLGPQLLDDKHLLPTVAHELSHAWFAGLLRDPQGRWSEGLASYLSQWPLSSDRARLMRWGWMVGYEQVPAKRDTPLKGDSPAPPTSDGAAEAIFYGKAALVLQELEGRVGIEKMRQILNLFVYQYRGRSVRWRELQQSVADQLGNEEARRLGHWLSEASAPLWQLRDIKMETRSMTGTLVQASDFAFAGSVTLATMNEQSEILSTLVTEVSEKRTPFAMDLPKEARWIVVDPNYTMPRRGSLDGTPQWMVRIRE